MADILNESILRLLNGSRRRPEGVDLVAIVAMTMRSIADEHWRVVRRERPILVAADGTALEQADGSPEANPERAAAAAQALAGLDRLFAQDAVVLKLMAGLAEGLSADRDQVALCPHRNCLCVGPPTPAARPVAVQPGGGGAMSYNQHPTAACERLLDALALELLEASADEFGPRHGGRSLKAAADQVRWRVAQALRQSPSHRAPVCPEHRDGAPAAPTE